MITGICDILSETRNPAILIRCGLLTVWKQNNHQYHHFWPFNDWDNNKKKLCRRPYTFSKLHSFLRLHFSFAYFLFTWSFSAFPFQMTVTWLVYNRGPFHYLPSFHALLFEYEKGWTIIPFCRQLVILKGMNRLKTGNRKQNFAEMKFKAVSLCSQSKRAFQVIFPVSSFPALRLNTTSKKYCQCFIRIVVCF